MMMESMVRAKVMEVVPFVVMVIMEGCTIALTIWAKTVMSDYGMSPYVFVVYTNVLSTILILPCSFLFHGDHTGSSRLQETARITPGLAVRFFFLGLTGITLTQYLVYVGLDYSSPILVCAMGHLIPTFGFLLAIILRTVKLDLRNPSFQAKSLGTFITVSGAVFVTLYKGPVVRKSSSSLHLEEHVIVFASVPEYWIIGGILLAGGSFSVSVWNIIQSGTVNRYPHVTKVVAFYSLIGTIQCMIISLAIERDLNAWKLKLGMELYLIIATAIFGGLIRSSVQIWCVNTKGPLYVPMFMPFRIIFASLFGICFFGNSIYYGSITGAIVMGIGYYALMWGQTRDNEIRQDRDVKDMDPSESKVPLLQEDMEV